MNGPGLARQRDYLLVDSSAAPSHLDYSTLPSRFPPCRWRARERPRISYRRLGACQVNVSFCGDEGWSESGLLYSTFIKKAGVDRLEAVEAQGSHGNGQASRSVTWDRREWSS
ncbi:hypothetical protein LIA77_04757 [Sarocladium implicatum]|nr:hypothetical protein LIA77_04757 [Sarocladium implicatum]